MNVAILDKVSRQLNLTMEHLAEMARVIREVREDVAEGRWQVAAIGCVDIEEPAMLARDAVSEIEATVLRLAAAMLEKSDATQRVPTQEEGA